jgi:hypothetical protein
MFKKLLVGAAIVAAASAASTDLSDADFEKHVFDSGKNAISKSLSCVVKIVFILKPSTHGLC